MMKRLILPLLLLCLLLSACGNQPQEEQTQPQDNIQGESPTEPGGSYLPESEMELATDGAVRAYPLSIPNVYAIAQMGDHVLVFSGQETTTLTRLSGDNLYVTASAQVGFLLQAEDACIQISDKGVTYYDPDANQIVVLDAVLAETGRIDLPEGILGEPVLSSDRKQVFYCTAEGMRCLTRETGISQLLKQMSYPQQRVVGLLMENSVVHCVIADEDGREKSVFLSATTGQTLYEGEADWQVTGYENSYFAVIPGGMMCDYVFGTGDGETQTLVAADYTRPGVFLPETMGFVTYGTSPDSGECALDYYDLTTGSRQAQLTLPGVGEPEKIVGRPGFSQVYLLCRNDSGAVVYRWDLAASGVTDESDYSQGYYTLKNPDADGYAQCQALADSIYENHGVRVLFGQAAVEAQPWNYDLAGEHHVPVLLQELQQLEQLLAAYPAGFLKAAAQSTDSGVITICLVRSITASAESGETGSVQGLQFRDGTDIYVALAAGSVSPGNLYHQMYYALETRLLSNSNECYDWDDLNPKKFEYDYDAEKNAQRDPEQYLGEEDRYFIDVASMNSPSADRATILEYAMQPGNESYFQSPYMQKKLRALCKGLREAYGLENSTEVFLWEQYLEKPLAKNK